MHAAGSPPINGFDDHAWVSYNRKFRNSGGILELEIPNSEIEKNGPGTAILKVNQRLRIRTTKTEKMK